MCDYSASVGMRGVMFANTQVQSNSGSVAGGWRPLHKPEWFQRFKTVHSDMFLNYIYFFTPLSTPILILVSLSFLTLMKVGIILTNIV